MSSPIVDTKTSLTMNDVCRLLKGFLREQNAGGALYCLAVLDRAACLGDARRFITIGALEAGIPIDFSSYLAAFTVEDNNVTTLRALIKIVCGRGGNHASMASDMIARIAGLNNEPLLVDRADQGIFENTCYPRVLRLIRLVRRTFADPRDAASGGFFIQAVFALLFALEDSRTHNYIVIWRAVRLQRLLVLGGFAEPLWALYAVLPDFYEIWDTPGTRAWLAALAALRPFLRSRVNCWDKSRLLHTTIATGLLYGGFKSSAAVADGVSDEPSLPQPMLPPWFYATRPPPPAAVQVLKRADRPTRAAQYVAQRYGKTDAIWDDLRADLTSVMDGVGLYVAREGDLLGPQCAMAIQSARFRPRLQHARVTLPPDMPPPALSLHVFVRDPAVNGSGAAPFHDSFVLLHMASPATAALYPTSIMHPGSDFLRAVEKFLPRPSAQREAPRKITLLVGGPFCEVEPISKVIAYRGFLTALGFYDGDTARFEPHLHLQRDRTLLVLWTAPTWEVADVNSAVGESLWVLECVLRYVLETDSTFVSADMLCSGDFYACFAAYYPTRAAHSPATCVAQLAAVPRDTLTGAIDAVADTLTGSLERAVRDRCPSILQTPYVSGVVQSISIYAAKIAALRAALEINIADDKEMIE